MSEERISVDFVAGQLSTIRDLVAEHSDNSKRQFDQVNKRLDQAEADDRRRDERAEVNKQAAIEARQKLDQKVDVIGAQATRNADWIAAKGEPMHAAWLALSAKEASVTAERKGSAKTWAYMISIVTAVGSVLVWLGKEAIASALEKIARVLH